MSLGYFLNKSVMLIHVTLWIWNSTHGCIVCGHVIRILVIECILIVQY